MCDIPLGLQPYQLKFSFATAQHIQELLLTLMIHPDFLAHLISTIDLPA